jgi:DNA-binding MarR family transcriptional regulator
MSATFTESEMAAWGGLLTVYGRMDRLIEHHLQQAFGISHVEFEILLRLAWSGDGRMRLNDLAEGSVLSRSGVSRAVDRLRSGGLVARSVAAEDRRGAVVELTEAGRRLFDRAMSAHVDLVRREFLTALSPADQTELTRLLRAVKTHQDRASVR